eukprot:15451148-Alexandrium_andersonii.AAC.1
MVCCGDAEDVARLRVVLEQIWLADVILAAERRRLCQAAVARALAAGPKRAAPPDADVCDLLEK